MIKVQLVVTDQTDIDVSMLGFPGPKSLPGKATLVVQVDAVVPDLWRAADLLHQVNELLSNHAEAEEGTAKLLRDTGLQE